MSCFVVGADNLPCPSFWYQWADASSQRCLPTHHSDSLPGDRGFSCSPSRDKGFVKMGRGLLRAPERGDHCFQWHVCWPRLDVDSMIQGCGINQYKEGVFPPDRGGILLGWSKRRGSKGFSQIALRAQQWVPRCGLGPWGLPTRCPWPPRCVGGKWRRSFSISFKCARVGAQRALQTLETSLVRVNLGVWLSVKVTGVAESS